MPDVELFLFGSPRIERGGARVHLDTRKAVALLAYLAVTGGRQSRETLAGLLWPEYGPSRARAALRRTLSALAAAREEGWLIVDRVWVDVDRGRVWVDVDRFHELLAGCRSHGHPEAEACPACLPLLAEAAELYRDDFLAGFGLRDSFDFDDWQYFQAESLRRELAGVLDRLARGLGARGEWEAAIGHARRRLTLDPLHEPAHRALMQLYALAGQRAAALRQYRECARRLEKELGVAPLEETDQLLRSIEAGEAPPLAPLDPPAAPAAASGPSPPDQPVAGPLVGRSGEWRVLREEHASAGGGGRFVVIEGEAGIGKTRLAEEFAAHARSEGATAMVTRCYPGGTSPAYGPFVELLSEVASRPELAARLEEVPARFLSEASRLLPELAGLYPDLPPPPPFDAPGAQSRFLEATARVLLAVLEAEPGGPAGVLFLDDLQWADGASLDLLAHLLRRLGGHPLLVLAAWRGEEVPEDHRLRHLVAETRRAGLTEVLALGRLDRAGVAELVAAAVGDRKELELRLYEETEGLPLFLTEYLAAISRDGLVPEAGEWTLPGGVRDLLRGRLRRPGEAAGQVLAAAAVIGRSFDFDAVWRAGGRGEEETVAALEELMSRGLIRETAGDPGGSPAYDFSHDKLRALVYDETSLARRRLLHRRVAEALAGRARGREAGPLAARIAHHYGLAGRDAKAAGYHRVAGEHARALYANAEAIAHFREALGRGHPDAAGLHEALGDLHALGGDYGAAISSYRAAVAAGGAGPGSAEVECKLGNVHRLRGEWDPAQESYEAALAKLEVSGSSGALARLYGDRSLLAHRRGRTGEAVELARRALEFAEAANDARALATNHNLAGMLAKSGGDLRTARRHLERSLTLSEDLDPSVRVAALNNLALTLAAGGETGPAIEKTGAALALCASIGDRHHEAALHNNLADLLHAAGRHEEAMSHLKKAVTIFAEVGEEGEMQPEVWKLAEW